MPEPSIVVDRPSTGDDVGHTVASAVGRLIARAAPRRRPEPFGSGRVEVRAGSRQLQPEVLPQPSQT